MKKFKNNLSRNEMRTICAGDNGGGTQPYAPEGYCYRNADCFGGAGYCCRWSDGTTHCQGNACSN